MPIRRTLNMYVMFITSKSSTHHIHETVHTNKKENMAYSQVPDIFEYEGLKYHLQPYIFRPYFKEFPERRINKSRATFLITNHHRLYIAHIKIFGKELKLVEFEFRKGRQEYESKLEKSFPNEKDRKLSWFSGIILLGIDNDNKPFYNKAYYHSLFLKEHDKYVILEFEKGNLTKEPRLEKEGFNQFMNSQLELFQLTERYKEEREKIINLFTKRNEIRNKTWEVDEEEIKSRLIKNLLFINRLVTF